MSSGLHTTPEHEAFRETVRKFTQEEMRPRAREFDAAGRIDKGLFAKMGELGMLGLRYDPAYGGAGLDWSFSAVMHEELGRSDNRGATLAISVHTEMATPSLAQFGSEDLKQQYLVPAIEGQTVAAIAVTEPDAGSDVSAIKTRAVRDGDDWVINGSKLYITNAANADWLCLLAVTDPDAGYSGFSQIIVPTDRPGVRFDLLGQDRALGLGHRAVLLRGRAGPRRPYDRRSGARLPAADDAVPARASGGVHQRPVGVGAPVGGDQEVV